MRFAAVAFAIALAGCTPATYLNKAATPHVLGERTWNIKVLSDPPNCRIWAEGGSSKLMDVDTFKYRPDAVEAGLIEARKQCCANPVVVDVEQYQMGFANFEILMRCPSE